MWQRHAVCAFRGENFERGCQPKLDVLPSQFMLDCTYFGSLATWCVIAQPQVRVAFLNSETDIRGQPQAGYASKNA